MEVQLASYARATVHSLRHHMSLRAHGGPVAHPRQNSAQIGLHSRELDSDANPKWQPDRALHRRSRRRGLRLAATVSARAVQPGYDELRADNWSQQFGLVAVIKRNQEMQGSGVRHPDSHSLRRILAGLLRYLGAGLVGSVLVAWGSSLAVDPSRPAWRGWGAIGPPDQNALSADAGPAWSHLERRRWATHWVYRQAVHVG